MIKIIVIIGWLWRLYAPHKSRFRKKKKLETLRSLYGRPPKTFSTN